MKKTALACVMAILCGHLAAQKLNTAPYALGERLPNIPLNNLLNYKTDTASLAAFGNKTIILSFWHTHCGACLAMFTLEDSLQQEFNADVQFILVTEQPKKEIVDFVAKWNSSHKQPLTLPIVTEDKVLHQLLLQIYNPHYVWIEPNGTLAAQTSADFINRAGVGALAAAIKNRFAQMRQKNLPPDIYHFLPLTAAQQQYLNQISQK